MVPVIIYRQLLLNIGLCACVTGVATGFLLDAFESYQDPLDIKIPRKTLLQSSITRLSLPNNLGWLQRRKMLNRRYAYFPSVPISPNLPKVTIATEPRKYSKYNGVRSSRNQNVLRYSLLQSFTQTAMSKFIFGGGGCAHSLCLSRLLFSFSNTSISRFFFSCSHSKLEVLKISGRKGSLSLPSPSLLPALPPPFFFWRHVAAENALARGRTQKSRRGRPRRNVIWEATSALLLNRVSRHSAVFPLCFALLKSCSFYRAVRTEPNSK